MPAELEAITSSVNQVLSKIAGAQISELVANLRHTVQGLDHLVSSPETLGALKALSQTATAATVTLRNADAALGSMDGLVGVNSQLPQRYEHADSRGDECRALDRALTTYLERHPEALIRGKSGGY